MPILDARHDFAHPVEGDTAWSESDAGARPVVPIE